MTNRTYYAPQGGLPPQTALLTDRAVFTEVLCGDPQGRAARYHGELFSLLGENAGLGAVAAACRDLPKHFRNTSWK